MCTDLHVLGTHVALGREEHLDVLGGGIEDAAISMSASLSYRLLGRNSRFGFPEKTYEGRLLGDMVGSLLSWETVGRRKGLP